LTSNQIVLLASEAAVEKAIAGAALKQAYGCETEILSREATIECLRKRRHYATTGGRMVLDVQASFPQGGTLFHDDPALGPAAGKPANQAMMGDIVQLSGGSIQLHIDVLASAPIERIEIHNGLQCLETIRPYTPEELGNRIRVIWEVSIGVLIFPR